MCFWSRWIDVGDLFCHCNVHTLPLIWKEHGSHDKWLLIWWKLSYATTFVLDVKDRKGMPLYEFQQGYGLASLKVFTKHQAVHCLKPSDSFILCCSALLSEHVWTLESRGWKPTNPIKSIYPPFGVMALILERNKPGSLRGINFANTNNIVQTLCFPWRPDFCLRCGIFSHLAFDDPFKQNLPKNAEWTSIKCAVVICSSPHIRKVSQSNLRTNNLNISMLQYVSILSPSFASCQPAPNVVRKFKHTHFSRSQSVPVLKTEATAAMCLKDMDLIHLTHINWDCEGAKLSRGTQKITRFV